MGNKLSRHRMRPILYLHAPDMKYTAWRFYCSIHLKSLKMTHRGTKYEWCSESVESSMYTYSLRAIYWPQNSIVKQTRKARVEGCITTSNEGREVEILFIFCKCMGYIKSIGRILNTVSALLAHAACKLSGFMHGFLLFQKSLGCLFFALRFCMCPLT